MSLRRPSRHPGLVTVSFRRKSMPRKKRKNITLRALLCLLGNLNYFWVFQVEIMYYLHQFEFGFLVDVTVNLPLYVMFLICYHSMLISHTENIS